jgi:hypothetical protein
MTIIKNTPDLEAIIEAERTAQGGDIDVCEHATTASVVVLVYDATYNPPGVMPIIERRVAIYDAESGGRISSSILGSRRRA